jgi:NAD(P)-dependent dehydrogenase (short-subunit alcohol dehydrogenase family)
MANRRALVTGASRGIGLSIARALASDGDRVALVARSADRLEEHARAITASGGTAVAISADLSAWDAARDVVSRTTAALGGAPEIAVLSHASMIPVGKIHGVAPELADAAWQTDLRSMIAITGALVTDMMAARFGRIVVIGSALGSIGQPGSPLNSAIKAGLEGLVKNLAADFGRYGITANLIAPGFVDNERQRERSDDAAVHRSLAAAAAIQRLVEPEEVAAAALFLCSDPSAAITGAVLPVDGGLHIGHALRSR